MEYWLLIKVGMVVKGIVWGGYAISGGYGIATIYRYIKDYRDSVEKERAIEVK